MDFNTILVKFGLESSNFTNKLLEVTKNGDDYFYHVEEAYKKLICPYCNHQYLFVHGYRWVTIKLDSDLKTTEILKIKRIRYKCPKCDRTHTFKLKGIERNKSISDFIISSIHNEFFKIQSFTTISKRYDISVQTIINIFDEYTKIMPRKTFP